MAVRIRKAKSKGKNVDQIEESESYLVAYKIMMAGQILGHGL